MSEFKRTRRNRAKNSARKAARPPYSPEIAAAFSQDALGRICAMPEREFAGAFAMTTVETDGRRGRWAGDDRFYHFRDNGADILAVAHLDTVQPPSRRGAHFANSSAGPVVLSGALDDRLGAYIILDLLPKLGIRCDWLLTTGEEQGCSTAEHFTPGKDYNWMIEFDRGGTDVVMYQYEDSALRRAVQSCGAWTGSGSFSDICYLEQVGVKGMNWGVGYQDYHGPRSHAFLHDTLSMVDKFTVFHEMHAGVAMPHEPKPYGRYASSYYSGGSDCLWCRARNSVEPGTKFCEECQTCQDCAEKRGSCLCYTPRSATVSTVTLPSSRPAALESGTASSGRLIMPADLCTEHRRYRCADCTADSAAAAL